MLEAGSAHSSIIGGARVPSTSVECDLSAQAGARQMSAAMIMEDFMRAV
jgi:hypothetical protein